METAIMAAVITAIGVIVAASISQIFNHIRNRKTGKAFVFPSTSEERSTFDRQLKKLLPKAREVRLCGWSLIMTIDKHHDELKAARDNGCKFRILLQEPRSKTVEILDSVISETNPITREREKHPISEREITKKHLDKVIGILLENKIISSDAQNTPLHFCKTLLPFAMAMIECEEGIFWASIQIYPLHPDLPDDYRLQFRSTDPGSSLWQTLKVQFDEAWENSIPSPPYSLDSK